MNSQTTPATLAREVLDLVSLPEVYLKVRELLDDPGASLVDLARVISVDPGLASRILRIANSAFCGFATPIETVPHAVTLLGAQQVHDLVLATSIARAFSGIPAELVNMEQFWRISVFCGAHAMVIADNCGILDSERLFTTGLLAHIGRLVLYLHLPTAMREAHIDASQKGISIPRALENKLGFDDAAVAGELLSTWKLPVSLVEPVRKHTHPEDHRDGDLGTAVVHVASMIADTRDLDLDAEELIQRLDETAWLALELNPESLSDLVTDGERLASDIVDLFLPESE
jgi:HD-like signal output (HDOD) protein